MNDITDRLRRWSISAQAAPASDLMDEAADEIERLRSSCAAAVQRLAYETGRLRLTDAEREAVRFCVTACLPETEKLGGVVAELCRMHATTLRGLLDRLE